MRFKASLRRTGGLDGDQPEQPVFHRLRIQPEAKMVWQDGEGIELTSIEFDLLHARAPRAACSQP